ncbi:hypothetical protein GCM10007897_44540 [Sphingobium jiangsuense]|uniref:EAL domain-containing protein (Putative c-di-GMP-specific phosphodiesterase class I) n=1 Tax=Sphingobium jiangsuense TaxID=870476 RepID=A0A7W6BL19_9SPHN|nr:EAL domain-containing protein [Sphingobium jiangsuense]MBB3927032.1 EAL domain-containing protein (putative c-di-GMP-specific phosphodiesterase class I) [Sphingobium jiangsuense]GLT03015.1 hypothetical protein GCM10007897_44540 [Sphingobium jiangsuense]
MPPAIGFDVVIVNVPAAPDDCVETIRQVAATRPGATVILLCDDDLLLTRAASTCAVECALHLAGLLTKPLKLDRLESLLGEQREQRSRADRPGRLDRLARDGASPADYVFQSKHDLRGGHIVGYETFLRVEGVEMINDWFTGLDHDAALAMTVSAARAVVDLHGRIGGGSGSGGGGGGRGGVGRGARGVTVGFNCPCEIFADARFLAELTALSGAAGLPGNRIAVELIDCRGAMPLGDLHAIATRYVAAGFEVHLDDFGMNAASLDRIVHLPLKEVKFDRGFFDLVQNDPHLLDEIISLCHLRGMTSTVTRIEEAAELATARRVGADYGQGYYWSRPAPVIRPLP